MNKQVISYLLVGIVAFAIGTFSTLNAEEKNKSDQEVLQKLDKVLANQDEIKAQLTRLMHRFPA